MNKQINRVWSFASDSNPNIEYETLQYTDGTTSCNCKGWTRRVAQDGSRSCKHSRYVDMGTANDHCTATHSCETQLPGNPLVSFEYFPGLSQSGFHRKLILS